MKKKARKRTDARQKRFIQEYLVDLNATQAAIRAGYSKKTASEQGYQLLQKTSVQRAIARAQKKRGDKLEITAARVLQELAIIAFSDISDYETVEPGGAVRIKAFEDMPGNSRRAIASIEEQRTISEPASGEGTTIILNDKRKFKLWDKLKANELIGRHLGMFNDKLSLSGKIELSGSLSITDLRKSLAGYREAK